MIMNRVWAMPNKWTFTIMPIADLLTRYEVGKGWADPFCGQSSICEYRNDLDPENTVAEYHLEAYDFVGGLPKNLRGVVFDPPYSYRQVTEHYAKAGIKATQLDTSSNFYARVMNGVCDKIRHGGYAISFGWNSNGFGKNRGFELIEILLVAHGSHHNDTIVVVEQKV